MKKPAKKKPTTRKRKPTKPELSHSVLAVVEKGPAARDGDLDDQRLQTYGATETINMASNSMTEVIRETSNILDRCHICAKRFGSGGDTYLFSAGALPLAGMRNWPSLSGRLGAYLLKLSGFPPFCPLAHEKRPS